MSLDLPAADEPFIDLSPKALVINFDTFFRSIGETPPKIPLGLGEFNLNKKRTYNKLGPMILESFQTILSMAEVDYITVIKGFYNFQMFLYEAAQNKEVPSPQEVFAKIDEIVSPIYEHLFKYVNENYHIPIESSSSKNDELQFNREKVIILVAVSQMMRFTVPLLSSYVISIKLLSNEDSPDIINRTFLDYFDRIINEFTKFSTVETSIQNKLHRLVEANVERTEYSDVVIWMYLSNAGISPTEFAQPLYKKMITDIIPKLSMTENAINYLHVVLRFQIKFLFKAKLPLSYKAINSALEPDESSVFDTNLTRVSQNEMVEVLAGIELNELIAEMRAEFGAIDEATLQHYKQHLVLSNEKTKMFMLFYSKFLSEHEALYTATSIQFFKLYGYMVEFFAQNNFVILHDLMLSNNDTAGLDASKIKLSKKYSNLVFSSRQYTEMLTSNFSSIQARFVQSNSIMKMMELLLSYKKVRIPLVGENYPETVAHYEIRPELLGSEMLRFVEFLRG